MVENELDSMNLPFLAKANGPPWLPGPVAEARKLAYWAQWFFVLFALVYFIAGVVSLIFFNPFAFYAIATAIVYVLLLYLMRSSFFGAVDQGNFREAHDKLLIFMILGIIFGLIPGILLLLAYLKMQPVFQPNYQPYPEGQYQTGPASPQQQYQAPPSQAPPAQQPPTQQAPPAAPAQPEPQKTDMVKCKKCGVQYPAFMRTCPNCNEPR
jgi:hypothetical protein